MSEDKKFASIRERRFILELMEMDSKFEWFPNDKPICQLAFFNASFALNSIPQAVVGPLVGTIINDTENSEGHFSSAFSLDKILEFATNRVPVAVVLRVSHSFSTELDNQVVDKQYWNADIRTYNKDYYGPGLYATDSIIIFKGYILPPTINIETSNTQIRLTLIHWLANIADISLLTPFCHTSVPNELALQTYSTPSEAGEKENTWAVITTSESAFKEPKSLWENGIKKIFNGVVNFYTNTKFYTNYMNQRKEDILNALNNIEADKSLTFLKDFTDYTSSFNVLVGFALKSENYQNFINITAWDKLIKQYSPAFLFSVVPRVSKALLIPTPTTEWTENDKVITIENDEFFNITSLPISNLVLNRLVCVPPEPTDISRTVAAPATYIVMSTYPPKEQCINRSGFISSITYPSWLGLPVVNKIEQPSEQIKIEDADTTAITENEAARQEELQQLKELKETIADQFTKFAYLTQVYNSTWTNLKLPCRMDICPGSMIKCIIKQKDIEYIFYGTVVSVLINILPGTNVSNTQISLTNIRYETLANDPIENPKDPVGFYINQWSGKDVALYD